MEIKLSTPATASLDAITVTLASWQTDAIANHIHPGDLGWFQRLGPDKTAESIRTWSTAEDGTILAIGLLDGDDLLRVTTPPSARRDEALARAMAADITDPTRGVFAAGLSVSFDAPSDALVRDYVLEVDGWFLADDEWTWLRKERTDSGDEELQQKLTSHNLRVEIVKTPEQAAQRVEVQALAFKDRSSFTVEKWQAMAASPAYTEQSSGTARCLLMYNENDEPIAAATVWSAGVGKPGILEPVGVSLQHQGRGMGTILCRAAAAELRRMGASSAVVATPSSNVAAVATYKKAGFGVTRMHRDLCRDG